MKANEFRQFLKTNPTTPEGKSWNVPSVDCDHLEEAEQFVAEYPVDLHGFAVAAKVTVGDSDAAKVALKSAGYVWDAESKRWTKDGFWAVAAVREDVTMYVYRAAAPVAWSDSPSHPAESLGHGR